MLPITRISLPTPWPATGPVHVYLIKQDPITLIDTGLNDADSRAALLEGLRAEGLAVQDIRRVLLTHAHVDHFGQAAWLQEAAGAEVWLHPDEAGKAENPPWWREQRDEQMRRSGVPRETERLMEEAWRHTRALAEPLTGWLALAPGQRFEFEGGALAAVHLPGHALGHTGFWEAASGTLVGGDHLLNGITPNPVMEPLPPEGHPAAVPHAPGRALTLGQFLGALDQAAAMPVRQVLPGHGPIITDHRTLVEGYKARHERRLGRLWEKIQHGATPYAVAREVFPKVREMDIFLALSEVLAHLDLLAVRGQAEVVEGGVFVAVTS
jgi:glyoxylase-like metal-dependent hydrolase (beta-lactamase superfamily II)